MLRLRKYGFVGLQGDFRFCALEGTESGRITASYKIMLLPDLQTGSPS